MSHQPQTDQQTSRRIVSKGAYVRKQIERVSNGALGSCFWLAALPCVLAALFFCLNVPVSLWVGYSSKHILDGVGNAFTGLCVATFIGGVAFCLCRTGSNFLKDATETDPGIPLTRANTADLPAPDSLVRASEEPKQEPQAVLLRAATADVERHEEQLVRAAGGTE